MAEGWIYLTHPETGGAGRFPNDSSVLAWYTARGWEQHVMPPELDPDSPNNTSLPAEAEMYEVTRPSETERILTADEVLALKGQALDEALDKAELSKAGTADEKRARLAEYEAGLANTTPEGEVNG